MTLSHEDKAACAERIQGWGYFRDQGRWPELLETFHPDGTIAVTWFAGPFAEFVERSKRSYVATAPRSKHFFGPSFVRGSGDRAVAETNGVIIGSLRIEGIRCEGRTHARFLDRLERRAGEWRILQRTAIYERDELSAAVPSEAVAAYLAGPELSRWPLPYRYLADRLVRRGLALVDPIYCDGAPETERLLAQATAWAEAA